MRTTTRLREQLASPDLIVAPGAYDALSARLIAQAGFPAVYMTGFGTAASVLGQPDVGLLTMSEMVSRAAAILLSSLPSQATSPCRSSQTLILAMATLSTYGVPFMSMSAQALPACISKTRFGPRNAGIWRENRSSLWMKWSRKSAPPLKPGKTLTL